MSKVKEIATHKASIWSYISVLAGVVGYGGVQTVGVPTFDKISIKMNDIEHRQDSSILLQKEYITLLKTDLYLRYPRSLLDSIKKEVILEEFWRARGEF